MSTPTVRARSKPRALLALVTTFLVALSGLFVVPAANAAPPAGVAASDVSIDWGFTDNWRGYQQMFAGETAYAGGASANPAPYNWGTAGTGVFDPDTRTGLVSTTGSVNWFGWHGIDVTLSNPTIVLTSATSGELRMDYNRAMDGAGAPTGTQVAVATLDLSAATVNVENGSASFSGVQATGTAVLNDIFTQYGGARLDDLSFSFAYEAPQAEATATSLVVSPGAVSKNEAVTLTATVSPAAAGTVAFFDDGTQLGEPQAVSAGVATLTTTTLAAGTHGNLTATFTPEDPTAFQASTSAAATVTVNGPTISASVTEATEDGLKVSATVSNIVLRAAANVPDTGKDDMGVYIGIIEADRVSEYGADAAAGAKQDFAYKTAISNGQTTRSIDVPAAKLDRSKQYVAVSWLAHGFLNDTRFLAQTPLAVTGEQWDAVFGPEPVATTLAVATSATSVSDGHQVGITATLTSAAVASASADVVIGKIQLLQNGQPLGAAVDAKLAKGKTSVSVTGVSSAVADATTAAITATFTPGSGQNYAAATANTVNVTGTPATGPWNPEISVFLKTGDTEVAYAGQKVYRGDELVVRGSGFDPEANVGGRGAPLPIGPQGTYVVFGNFDATGWKPSENVASTKRKATNQGWVLAESVLDTVAPMYQNAVRAQWAKPVDGAFEWSSGPLTTPAALENGEFGIYTYAAGGAVNAAEELAVPIDYIDAVRPGSPSIEVFLSDGTTPYTGQEVEEGDQLVVRGTGFDPYANVPGGSGGVPIPNSLPQGAFAVFGNFATDWKPSNHVASDQRKIDNSARTWLLAEDTLDAVPNNAPTNFRDVIRGQWTELDPETGSFEWTVTLKAPAEPLENGNYGIYTYAGGAGVVTNAAQELYVPINFKTVTGEPEGPETPATGGLIWSFKTSWNFYLANIANGTATVSNGATKGSNGEIGYVQVEGGDYDAETGLGTIRYQGVVRYVSEAHGFDIAMSDPWVVFGENGATITANVSHTDTSGVADMARITVAALEAGDPVAADDLLTWAAVNGTFDANLGPDGWSRYAGESIDQVTFSYGADTEELPENDPEITLSKSVVKQGDKIVFTGTGFEPGTLVTATVHSDPIVLGTKPADESGTVSFDFVVPKDFEVTTHTIEFTWGEGEAAQSLSDTFTVERANTSGGGTTTPPVESCVARAVTGGTLNWGLKESFRAYVQGNIAKGTFSGGSFAATGGALNVKNDGVGRANFSGAITATGHNGLLNFQLSNPSVQITGAHTGILYAHVNSTSSSGAQAVNGTVAFANLSFGGVAINGDTVSVSGAAATLTGAGAQAFAGFYGAGTALDPVSFSVSLGGEVACDSTTDPTAVAELAKTGSSEPSIAAFSLAGMIVLLGAGLILARRRREFAKR